MEILQLEHFLAVAEDGSFTRAAQRMCRTQPAISQSIKKLEDELGSALFTRDLQQVALTDAGKALAGYARKMIATRNKAALTVGALKHLSSGALKIAAHESAAIYLLPGALRHYVHTFPNVRISIYRSRPAETPRQVIDRGIDIGFVTEEPGVRELQCVPVHSDEMVLIASPGHALARRQQLMIGDLDGVPQVAHRECSTGVPHLLKWFSDRSVRCRIVAEAGSYENIKSLVREDVGIAVVPGVTVQQELAAGTLVQIRCPELQLRKQSFVIYRAMGQHSSAAKKLIEIIRNLNWELPAPVRQVRRA